MQIQPDARILIATPEWAEAMAAIHTTAFHPAEAWDAEAFRTQLTFPGVIGLVQPGGAMILVRVAADEAEVLTLAVVPDVRRQGVASVLLHRAIATLASHGARTLFLEVSDRNLPALALYRKAGFIGAGRRRHYYADGSDAYVMRRSLGPAV
jgi:ribosomal-protein-alanine N-acetyltransferase